MMYDMRIIHGQCYIDHEFQNKHIYIQNGQIAKISNELLDAHTSIDATGLKVLPGLIDPHVHLHLNLGDAYSVDDFNTGSMQGALGGVTTIIDFLDPIYNNLEFHTVLERRLKEAETAILDYSFHCTLANYKDDLKELMTYVDAAGITSVKVFTTYSDSDRKCTSSVIKQLLKEKIVTLVHSEDDDYIHQCQDLSKYESSRCEAAELSAINTLLRDKEGNEGKLYIVHISSGHTLAQLNSLEHVYYESCPQYFYLSKDVYDTKDGYKYLLAPPLRSKASIKLLKENIDKLHTIGTDHCSFLLEDKFKTTYVDHIPKGIGSLGYAFQLMYELFGDAIIPKFTSNTAAIFNLDMKGKIALNYDADFALLDNHGKTVCSTGKSASDYSVYEGIELNSQFVMTIRRGQVIMKNGVIYPSQGHFLRRKQ